MATAKITKKLVESARVKPEDGVTWDTELKGFGLRVKATGVASFVVQYRTSFGVQRRVTIGSAALFTPEQARDRARKLLQEARDGGDPADAKVSQRNALTLAGLIQQYREAAEAGLVLNRSGRAKAASTLSMDNGRFDNHLIPAFGKTPVAAIAGRRDIIQQQYDKWATTIGKSGAKRLVGLLGGVWTWAAARGFVSGENPTRGVIMAADQTRETILTEEQLAALGAVLAEEDSIASDVVKLLALTGLRQMEATGLMWSQIHPDRAFRLEKTKTGKSKRPIGQVAWDFLHSLPKRHDIYVFPNSIGTGPANIKAHIAALFEAAGIEGESSQTLRRTFASIAGSLDYGDSTIGEMLGHAQRGTTAKHYIRPIDKAVLSAADATAERIATLMGVAQ